MPHSPATSSPVVPPRDARTDARELELPSPRFAGPVIDARQERMILVATCTALMAVVAAASGLNVAQQQVALDLHASQSGVLWIINAYTVALAALLLPVGAIADRWGRKPVMVSGLVVFALASAAAGLVDSVAVMIAVRVAAGVGAAMVMPVTLSVITSSFPEDRRGHAIGVWSAVAGGGGLLGMITSAVLADLASWRWLFALPVLLAAAAFVLTVRAVPNSLARIAGRFDALGSVLSVVAIGGLVLGIFEGPARSWSAPVTIIGLTCGVLGTIAFVVHERRCPNPLLEMRVFADRRLSAGAIALLVLFAVLGGVFVVLFPFFEAVLGWSPISALLGLLPMLVVMMSASGAAANASKQLSARTTMLAGIAIATAGLALMAGLVSASGGYLSVLPGMLLIGLGVGVTMPLGTEAITASLPAERQGVASALNDITRELGGAIGVAVLGAALTAAYRAAIIPALHGLPPRLVAPASTGIARAFAVASHQHNASQTHALINAARHAFVHGWSTSMWIGAAGMFLLLLFLSLCAPHPTANVPPTPDQQDPS
jgi:EmrB/QacA subfamily drug resistance transporter